MKTYTVKEVSKLLNVSQETVRRWIRDKKLNAQKSSNKSGNKILESELAAFLKSSPAYAASLSSLLLGGLGASAVMLATYATGKAIESNAIKNAKVDGDTVVSLLQSEIASHEMLVKHKQENIQQIQQEIAAEQKRIRELKALLSSIEKAPSQIGGDSTNG